MTKIDRRTQFTIIEYGFLELCERSKIMEQHRSRPSGVYQKNSDTPYRRYLSSTDQF